MAKVIITTAVTGSLTTKDQNPAIPITPQEIAAQAVASCQAGSAVVHLHVREPATGKPTQDPDLFAETIGLIRAECDMLINVSTGGGPGMSFDERIGVIPALAADPATKPELASLNAGSLNYGIYSASRDEFVLDAVQYNPWSELVRFARVMRDSGVKPEIEIYEAGMIHNALTLHKLGAVVEPLHFQFVLGVLGGMQATVENLTFLKTSLPPRGTWSVCAVGLGIFRVAPAAMALGGHVRVGLEDSTYLAPGRPAQGNPELVEKIKQMAGLMGLEVATPAEAREILGVL